VRNDAPESRFFIEDSTSRTSLQRGRGAQTRGNSTMACMLFDEAGKYEVPCNDAVDGDPARI